jgi:hypothetical protein
MNTYVKLINKHVGETSFIYGAGPSLYHNMQEPIFNSIEFDGITITVNSGVMACPNFNYWISNDSLCRRWSWFELVKKGKGIKVVRNSWKKFEKELDGFLYFKPRPTSEGIINPDDKGLSYCSSVPSAIDLSIQMGIKKIFILGLDHKAIDGKDHFWQFFPPKKRPIAKPPAQGPWRQQQTVFPINNLAYKALKKFAEHKEVEIYNCSYKSSVDIFKKIRFKDIKKYL